MFKLKWLLLFTLFLIQFVNAEQIKMDLTIQADIVVHMQGDKADKQQMFYSVYNVLDNSYPIKNKLVLDGNNFTITLPFVDKKNLTSDISAGIYQYNVLIYGARYKNADVLVPLALQFKYTDLNQVTKNPVGNCEAYKANISPDFILSYPDGINAKLAETNFNSDGDINKVCSGTGPATGLQIITGNGSPHKVLSYTVNINLPYELKDYITTKWDPLVQRNKEDNHEF